MKLRNKKTGEIKSLSIYGINLNIRDEDMPVYHSLKELNEEWEDYEEPKGIIKVEKSIFPTSVYIEYSTEEEAEKALKKLNAWKRLEDKGFKFERVKEGVMGHEVKIYARFTNLREDEIDTAFFDNQKDLELLFGSKDDC